MLAGLLAGGQLTRRHRLTDEGVRKLSPKAKRYTYADPELPGHYVRVSPNGEKCFVVVTRDPRGKQHWRTVGAPPMKIDDARDLGRKIIRSIREAPPDSFEGVAREWFKRHVQKRGLRSASEIERFMNQHLYPAWPGRDLNSIKRADVATLLDHIEDEHGARQADYALAVVRQIFNWHARRDENYSSPIVPGMRRTNPKETERRRILSDDEIRAVWNAASGSYGRLVQFLLLTAQRREKAAAMEWADLDGSTWIIKTEKREKGNAGELTLPKSAIQVLGKRGEGLVFPGRAGKQIKGWSKYKALLDKASGVTDWVLHDLRRTARSLMSRAGVRPDIAERVMGHAIAGVEGVYDRHQYRDEKADALKRLAGLVALVLSPPKGNVLKLSKNSFERNVNRV
jgi:integrase